jgi:hypothetical protein
MRTLSNNIRIPEDDDAGNVWADAIEHDLEELNTVITDLNNITVANINRVTTTLDKANWDVDPNGKGYKQTVSMPTGITLVNSQLAVRVGSGPRIYTPIQPTIIPLSLTAYEIIVNDSTLDLEILYV